MYRHGLQAIKETEDVKQKSFNCKRNRLTLTKMMIRDENPRSRCHCD